MALLVLQSSDSGLTWLMPVAQSPSHRFGLEGMNESIHRSASKMPLPKTYLTLVDTSNIKHGFGEAFSDTGAHLPYTHDVPVLVVTLSVFLH